jgi:hypothetical protein
MLKIKDRMFLGIIAGALGNAAKMAIDEASLKKKISQRSFRTTASEYGFQPRKKPIIGKVKFWEDYWISVWACWGAIYW